jgi:hypothetical protein
LKGGSGEDNEGGYMQKSLPTVAQIIGKDRIQCYDPSLTEYTLLDIIEKQEPHRAKVFRLVPLATSFLYELEDERSFIPGLADQLPVIVNVEFGGVPLDIYIPSSRVTHYVSNRHAW